MCVCLCVCVCVCVCVCLCVCVCVCVVLCRSPEECGTVIERIHSCYHPSLAPENRHLLEVCVCVFVWSCDLCCAALSEVSGSAGVLLPPSWEGSHPQWLADPQLCSQVTLVGSCEGQSELCGVSIQLPSHSGSGQPSTHCKSIPKTPH